jgi:hypothetical protein
MGGVSFRDIHELVSEHIRLRRALPALRHAPSGALVWPAVGGC